MKSFNYSVVGFCSLLLVLICFTSCEQQEVLTNELSDIPSLELLVGSSEVPDVSTMPSDLSVPDITSENSSTSEVDDRSPCLFSGGRWYTNSSVGYVWFYEKPSTTGGSLAFLNRHQLAVYIYNVQDLCLSQGGVAYYAYGSIGGYSGNFWDNNANDNWVYSYTAGRWIQH